MSFPGNANHEMGIARMGNDPKTSVLNKFNQMHEVPNVFIIRWFVHGFQFMCKSFINLYGAYCKGL